MKTRDNIWLVRQRILAQSIWAQRIKAQKGPLALEFKLDLVISL